MKFGRLTDERCILVEGPRWGDAAFYGKWLMAAAKANALWEKAIKDRNFQQEIERLMWFYIPDFAICATVLITYLRRSLASLRVYLGDWEAEEFIIMLELGFFVRTGERYQMVIPAGLTLEKVKKAALKLARTEDDESILHPEYLVATMPYTEAAAAQRDLRYMDEDRRCTERHLLLGDERPEGNVGKRKGTLPRSKSVIRTRPTRPVKSRVSQKNHKSPT